MSELVLVTGGAGYIAGWCIAELLERGYRVRTTVRSESKRAQVVEAVANVIDGFDAADGRLEFAVADLADDAGWAAAVVDADFVLHVASPFGASLPADPVQAVQIARDGALRVLRAASAAGVRRVVMTSAANAASPSSYGEDSVTDETLWTDPDDRAIITYRRSKTVAELAAWEFMRARGGSTEFVTVLPGAVFGPIMTTANMGSVDIIARMLSGAMPGVPRIGLEVVDVRDLVDAHLRAMTSPDAPGERFLATGHFIWMRDIAVALKDSLGVDAAKVSTRQLPDFVVKLVARFRDPELRSITPSLGRRNRHSTAKAEKMLKWRARPATETVVDCARSLLEFGAIKP